MVPLTKNETDPPSPAVLGTPPLRWQGLPILCESTCKVGEDTSCADGLRNLQSIKKNLLKTCYLDLISGNIWLSITSGCGSHSFQFVSHYLASSAPWTLCPKMDPNQRTSQPSTQSICLSPKLQHQCINVAQATLAAKVFFLYRQELPAVPPATPRLDCGTDE